MTGRITSTDSGPCSAPLTRLMQQLSNGPSDNTTRDKPPSKRELIQELRASDPDLPIVEIARRVSCRQNYVSLIVGEAYEPVEDGSAFVNAMIAAGYEWDARLSFPERVCTENPRPARLIVCVPTCSSMELF